MNTIRSTFQSLDFVHSVDIYSSSIVTRDLYGTELSGFMNMSVGCQNVHKGAQVANSLWCNMPMLYCDYSVCILPTILHL